MSSKSNFSFRLYIDKRYKAKSPDTIGKYPVKIRVASKVTGKYKNFSTDIYLEDIVFYSLYPEYSPKDIRKKPSYIEKSGIIARTEAYKSVKVQIDTEFELYINAETTGTITINQLTANLGYDNNTILLKDWVNNRAKEIESKSSKGILRACYLSFTAFHNNIETPRKMGRILVKKESYKELTLYDITTKFLKDWEKWMLSINKSVDSISTYARYLSHVLNLATEQNAYSKNLNPIGSGKNKYPIKENRQRINKYLLDEERVKFFKYKPENEAEQLAYDLWFFSYYSSGVNLVEITNMKHQQLNSDKTMWWYYRKKNSQKKVQSKVEVPINDFMRNIIDKYSGSGEYVFNFLEHTETRKLNRKISSSFDIMAAKLRIENICYMMARHSAFTNMSKKATPEEIIELGTHTSEKTLKKYIKKLDITEKQKKMYSIIQDE